MKIEGRIVRIESKDYYVLTREKTEIRCVLRGKFKKQLSLKKNKLITYDFAVVGDFVEFRLSDENTGIIESIKERKNYLSRKTPRIKGITVKGQRYEQIIAANVDNLFIVSSVKEPKFNNRIVDRIIVAAESSGIESNLVINKIDLDLDNSILKWKNMYENIGYRVFLTSATGMKGINEIKKELPNKVNVFWGASGVGKSSILNVLYPHLNFKVGEVSSYSQKGKHTTVTSIMKEVEENTFIIDTPGIREIDPYGIKREDLGHYFKEFQKYIHSCKFNSCTHLHEPGCAVIEAVDKNEISIERYESYLNILATIEDETKY